MDNFTKRLFADLRRLEDRVKHLEGLHSIETALSPRRALTVASESNHQGGAWAGTSAAQAQAPP